MWSIGCVTATLLTNDFVFADEDVQLIASNDDANADSFHSLRDLSITDKVDACCKIGRKAKSFIRGCLVLKEDRRLTTRQALSHAWLTNKHYATDIEGAYMRAIADWKPRSQSGSLVQFFDTKDVLPFNKRPAHMECLAQEIRSSHFPTAPQHKPSLSSSDIAKTLPQAKTCNQTHDAMLPQTEPPQTLCPPESLPSQISMSTNSSHVPDTPPRAWRTTDSNNTLDSLRHFAPSERQP